jgi:Rieske Fe-S protein
VSGADYAPCAGCGGIGRRVFLSQATLAAVTTLLADACGTGTWDPVSPPATVIPSTGLSYSLRNYPALANVGGIAPVSNPTGVPVVIVRTGAATFVMLSLICPHQGTTLNVSGLGFLCPNHGAKFAADGTWTGGQATANMTSYVVNYDAASGTLSIGAPPAPPPPATPVANGTGLVVTIASVPALAAVGGIARVDGNTSNPIALVCTAPSTYLALSMICPHQGATIDIQSGAFICPRHGARFAADGTWTGGQRTSSLRMLASTYDAAAGTVTITI